MEEDNINISSDDGCSSVAAEQQNHDRGGSEMDTSCDVDYEETKIALHSIHHTECFPPPPIIDLDTLVTDRRRRRRGGRAASDGRPPRRPRRRVDDDDGECCSSSTSSTSPTASSETSLEESSEMSSMLMGLGHLELNILRSSC